MIDFRYLSAFQAVYKHLSFTQASRELRTSVSALSRQIALMERGAGGELFIRSTRSVVPTPLGKRIYEAGLRFEQDLSAFQATTPLRLGCLQSIFKYFLADVIVRKSKVFEGPLDIVIGTPGSLHEKISAGELDLIVTNLKPGSATALSAFPLYQERLVWIGRENLRKSSRTIVFSAFEHAYSESSPHLSEGMSDRIWVNSFDAVSELVERKQGRAMVALPAKRVRSGSGAVGKSQQIYAVVPNYERLPTRSQAVLNALREEGRRF